MGGRSYIILRSWWWFTMLFALISVTSATTLTGWGSISAIVAGSIAFLLLIWGVKDWVINKRRLCKLFEVWYEEKDGRFANIMIIKTSKEFQYLRIILKMEVETDLDTIDFTIKGKGYIPFLQQDVSDGDYPWGPNHTSFCTLSPDRILNCRFVSQQHRNRGQKIRLHLRCIAPQEFDGMLEITLACGEKLKKTMQLPLIVKETKDDRIIN